MDQKQVFTDLTADLEKLKKEDPVEYLSLLTQIKEIASAYNIEVKAALAEAKS